MKLDPDSALVVLSGGQDSTTCLYWAKEFYDHVHALTFNYGQRHDRELEAAAKIAGMAGVSSYEVIDVPGILKGTSPLVNEDESVGHYGSVEDMPGGIEPTFVPSRNILFLTIASNRAACLGIQNLVTGVSQEDYGGYPDCRLDFILALRKALGLGITGDSESMQIQTPLINTDKKGTVLLAQRFPGCMEALAYSHTCYDGEYPPNPNNHASILRAKGFKEAGIGDPLIMRAKQEGLLPEDYPDHGLVVPD